MSKFRDDLRDILNEHSRENFSNTPDFVLAGYLLDCLSAFDHAVMRRDHFCGRSTTVDAVCGKDEQ